MNEIKNTFTKSLIFTVLLVLTGCNSNAKASLFLTGDNINISEAEEIVALDSCGKKALIKENDYADYKFTKKQKEAIQNMFETTGSASIRLCSEFLPSEKQQVSLYGGEKFPYYVGFLYADDFDQNGKLKDSLTRTSTNITVQADASAFISDLDSVPKGGLDVALSISKNQNGVPLIPAGIFVYSAMQCQIVKVCLEETKIGFDRSGSYPFFSFSSNGGIVDPSFSVVDFSGGSLVFPTRNSSELNLPEIEITLLDKPEFKSAYDASVYVKFKAGGEEISLNNVAKAKKLYIPVSSLKTKFPRMDIVQNKDCIVSMFMQNVRMNNQAEQEIPVVVPLRTDPGIIINYNQDFWRTKDYEVFQWDRYPEILIMDFKNFTVQDKFFTRLAFFVEKKGSKGTLLTNEQIGSKHGYNAHDYKAADLADFFNTAIDTNFKLNKEEIVLKQLLINNGCLERDGKYVRGVKGGVASVSWESGTSVRLQLLVHELYHTLFFINENFRNFVAATYYTTFDPDTKDYLIQYFQCVPGLNYDTNDEYLMLNEFMSYILQQKLEYVGTYFASRATRSYVQQYTPDLAAYIIQTNGKGFTDAGKMLEEFTFDEFGLKCGIVNLISK